MTWILSAGCTAPSDEPAAPAETVETVETVETAEPFKSARSEDCVITPPKQPVACTMQYDPVCGCDGKTYSNACMARGAGVPRSKPGACEDQLNQ